YVPDEHGAFVVPFSTAPGAGQEPGPGGSMTRGGTVPMLLSCGDVATVAQLELQREQYWLELAVALDRHSLPPGRTARAIARVRLSVAGAPCSVALLEEARWDVTLVDRAGVATTKSQPLALSDDDAAVLEWPLGDDTAQVTISVQGKVKAVSLQRD